MEKRDRPELGKLLHAALLAEASEIDHVDVIFSDEILIDGSFNLRRVAEAFLRVSLEVGGNSPK